MEHRILISATDYDGDFVFILVFSPDFPCAFPHIIQNLILDL